MDPSGRVPLLRNPAREQRGLPANSYTGRPLMAVPKRKTSKSRRDKRRAQHAIASPRVSTCETCGSPKQSHRACPTCKTYRGREIRPLQTPAP
jgi:large subunit ribosomal protein L32